MKKLLLIDSHAILHRMYHAMAPLTTPAGEPIGAIYGLSKLLLKMINETGPLSRGNSIPRCSACSAGDARRDDKTDDDSSALRSNDVSSTEQATTEGADKSARIASPLPARSVASDTPSPSSSSAQADLSCSRCGGPLERGVSKPDYIAACFDRPEPTFRKEAFPAYKAQRGPTDSELIPQLIRAREVFAEFKIKCFELPGFEADDLIATLATRLHNEQDLQVTILSGDRDLLQLVHDDHIVVELFKNGGGETTHMNESAVIEKYGLKPAQIVDLKGLVGDPSDNIPGVHGVGEKTATPLLKEFGTVEGVFDNLVIVPEKFAKKFEGHREVAMMCKKLATLERNAPIFLDSLQDLKFIPLDKEGLKKYFQKLGFSSLIRQIDEA